MILFATQIKIYMYSPIICQATKTNNTSVSVLSGEMTSTTDYCHSERAFFQINWAEMFWGIWGIFGQTVSTHFVTVSSLSMFSIIQPFFLQKTKPLYPTSKYLFGRGIWVWAAKNLRFSLRVSRVRSCVSSPFSRCTPILDWSE